MSVRRNPGRLGAQTADLRDEIMRRYAFLGPGGHPSRCHLPRRPKVSFPTREAADLAERELALVGGLRQSAYQCRDHFHLTKRLAPEVTR